MPRIGERTRVMRDLQDTMEVIALSAVLASDDEDDLFDDLEDVTDIYGIIESHRYLSPRASAGRHNSDILYDRHSGSWLKY